MTPELTPSVPFTTSHQREDVGALDIFNGHRFPTRWVFSGTGFELGTSQPRSDTLTTRLPRPHTNGRKYVSSRLTCSWPLYTVGLQRS
ncbi:hypothetical protein TNCV_3073371 [Trichonephila clavipes]|nr:hypothetical protein TNCV_3073371 [Trichonephila clavipes]